jgi:proline iminopeptidase
MLITDGKFLTVYGIKLWIEIHGTGPPFVLCHGGPGGYDYLAPLANMVDDLCTIIRYDQRGSGRSTHVGPYDVQTQIDDLDALRRQLNIKSWIVGGHSWGASLALAYSARFPQHVEALVYMSGTGINPEWHEVYRQKRFAALSETDRDKFHQLRIRLELADGEEYDKVTREIRILTSKTDLADIKYIDKIPSFDKYSISNKANELINNDWDIYMVRDEFRESVKHLAVSVLFLHGEQDPRSISFIKELVSYVPDSTFIPIPNSGHYPYIEQPGKTRAELRKFIKEKVQTITH